MSNQPSRIQYSGGRARLVGQIPHMGDKVMAILEHLGIRTWGELRRFGQQPGAMRRAESAARELNGGWSDFEIVNAFAQYSEPDFVGLPRSQSPARMEVSDRSLTCKNCGGSFLGDGFTVVLHCENAEEDDYQFCEPDASPVSCRAELAQAEA